MPQDELPNVRYRAVSADNLGNRHMLRLKIRVDFALDEQVIDWSIIAWEHPRAHMIYNAVESRMGFMFGDVALSDFSAEVAKIWDRAMDWTPDAAPPPDEPTAA